MLWGINLQEQSLRQVFESMDEFGGWTQETMAREIGE